MPQAAVPLVSLAQDLPQSHPMAVLVVPMPLATANLLGKLVPHPTTVQGVPVLAARSLLMTPLVPATVLAALGHHVQAKTGEQAADVVKVVVRQKDVVDIDFVDHGDGGPASAWARNAQAGTVCGFAGPGPIKVTSYYADSYLIVADMSALPVAAATLEAMPEGAKGTAIFEIMSPEDKQDFRIPDGIDVHWIVNADPREIGVQVIEMLRDMDWPSGVVQACIAGESGMIKTLRQDILVKRALPKEDCYISGYWKIGLIEDEHQQLKRAEAGK